VSGELERTAFGPRLPEAMDTAAEVADPAAAFTAGDARDRAEIAEPIQRVLAWAESEAAIRAVLVTGSRAAGGPLDRFSDHDVILYVTDTSPFAASTDWSRIPGPILVSLEDRTAYDDTGQFARLMLYEKGTKIDFTVAPAGELERIARAGTLPATLDLGYTVLVDKDGIAARLPPATFQAYIAEPPGQHEFSMLVEEFWWETTYVARALARDELLPAKYSLESVMKLDLLRRMLEWRVASERDWTFRPGVLGRSLRRHLDERTWQELEATFTGADIASNRSALYVTIALFRRIAMELADRLGLTYPTALDVGVSRYIESVLGPG